MTRYPRLNRQGTNRVSIPSLDGGINTKDNATLINDNQLVDAKNVWFDGQALKTRPKITGKYASRDYIDTGSEPFYNGRKKIKEFNVTLPCLSKDEVSVVYKKAKVLIYEYKSIDNNGYTVSFSLKADIFGYDGEKITTSIPIDCGVDITNATYKINFFVGDDKAENSSKLFCIVAFYNESLISKVVIFKLIQYVDENGVADWAQVFSEIYSANFDESGKISDLITDELYKPLIYINGKGNKYSYLPITAQTEYATASLFEGRNLLPSAMRFQFMTDGISNKFQLPIKGFDKFAKVIINTEGMGFKVKNASREVVTRLEIEVSDGVNQTEYGLDGDTEIYKSDEGKTITTDTKFIKNKTYYTRDEWGTFTEITDATVGDLISDYGQTVYDYSGNIVYTLSKQRYTFDDTTLTSYNTLYVKFDASAGILELYDGNDTYPLVLPMSVNNNIEVITYKTDLSLVEVMLNMQINSLYGGGQGIFGGTRTFLAGYKNKICWSDSGEPTYFSENNYVGVGDYTPITAFGKMDDCLVIFKKDSIYFTQACSSDAVTAEQVQNGEVVDISTTYAYFPIYQLSDEYGCDLPNTVKLCLNRLIFANSDGNVYCLVTQSNTSQRNIYCLSGQIRRKMFDESNNCLLNEKAFAAVFGDYYLLFCGNKVWALNYNKDSYRYVYSYTNRTNNSSSRYFTWWYWETDEEFESCINDGDRLFLNSYPIVTWQDNDYFEVKFSQVSNTESENDCECYIKTKVFDFSYADRYKKIEKLFLGIGNDVPANISLTIETDKGEVYNRPIEVDCNELESRFTAQYGETVRLIPCCNKIKQFSVKLEAKGVMSIEKMYIYYKMLSEVIG